MKTAIEWHFGKEQPTRSDTYLVSVYDKLFHQHEVRTVHYRIGEGWIVSRVEEVQYWAELPDVPEEE